MAVAPPVSSPPRSALHRYAVLTTVAAFCVLIAGALVTSTDSGLAVPDWPLSYGMWFPPMVGGILYEHGHRMVAAVVGLMILALAGWLWRVESRRWVRRLGYNALIAVVLQALLGGLTVLWLLPPQISIAHACLGQAVFCLTVCLVEATSTSWMEPPAMIEGRVDSSLARLGLGVAALAILQLVLGAVIRHTGTMVTLHVVGAAMTGLSAGVLAWRVARVRHEQPRLWVWAQRLAIVVGVQVALGGVVWTHRGAVGLRTGHVALGALVLACAVVLAWELCRAASWPPSALSARVVSSEAAG